MKKTLVLAALCTLGAVLALPAAADDRGRHFDRHERHVERHSHRHEHRDDWRDRREARRHHARDHVRYYRDDHRSRYVVRGRYCDDRRHLHSVHYHVAPRDYYAYGYPRDAYRLHRGSGIDATLVVTLPLF